MVANLPYDLTEEKVRVKQHDRVVHMLIQAIAR